MRTISLAVQRILLLSILTTISFSAAAQSEGVDNPFLFEFDNTAPALVTDRHMAARMAGYRALHYCTGVFTGSLSEAQLEESLSRRGSSDAETVIDREKKTVSVYYSSDMEPRIAAWRRGLGCTQLPIGATLELADDLPEFQPSVEIPNFDNQPWPMGDRDATAPLTNAKDAAVNTVLDEAFRNADGVYGGHTWGVVVVQDGKIVAERYEPGWDLHSPSRTNSMCKSISVSLVGIAVRDGLVDIHRKTPLDAWRTTGDPRAEITLNNLLQMGSGLYTEGGRNPQIELYGSGAPPSEVSVYTVVDSRPGDRYVYAGSDTIMATKAVREAINDDANWYSFPHQEFLWKIGMTRTTLETDWKGDFLISGQCWSTAWDFGRFGMLYLADGVWNGERILPEGWSDYVSTLAPAQPASYYDGGRGYGAQFWILDGMEGLPKAYTPLGAAGQYGVIIPSANLVVVRRGFDFDGGFNVAKFSADVMNALE
ncbi:MAG: serine hydrolase [Gammaproteobacteria bacterium]|nr:serine hydrolase [Gammaproteobacteria bacterium]